MEWEVVGKTKKNTANGTTKMKMSKNEKAKLLQKAPKLEELKTATDTKFSSLDIGRPKEVHAKEGKSTKTISTSSPKKADREKVKKPKTLEEAFKQLNHSELFTYMDNTKKRFNNNPAVVLPELASCLNVRLAYDGDEPAFTIDTPQDYLFSKLSNETRKYIENVVFSYENNVLERYLIGWFKEAIESVPKGAKYGSMLLVSILLNRYSFDQPQLEEIQSFFNVFKPIHPKAVEYYFWVVSIAGNKDPMIGLLVWKIAMSPFINYKEFYKATMRYLIQQLEKLPANKKVPFFCARDYFLVYGMFHKNRTHGGTVFAGQLGWMSNLQLVSDPDRLLEFDFRQKVIEVLPKFRHVCCGDYEKGGRELFLPYLEFVYPIEDESLQEEILDELIKCLCCDPECSKIWENELGRHLEQTHVILDHIQKHSHEIPVIKLRSVITEIYTICKKETDADKKLRTKSPRRWKFCKVDKGYYLCWKSSKKLLETRTQKRRSKRSFSMWNFSLILLFAGILFYDTQVNGFGNFKDGKMGQFLQSSGIADQWKAAQDRISSILFETHRHFLEFYPVYYKPLVDGAMFLWDFLAKTAHNSSLVAADVYYWTMNRGSLVVDKVEESFPGTKAKAETLYEFVFLTPRLGKILNDRFQIVENIMLMVDFFQVKFQEYLPVVLSILEKAGNFVKNTVLKYDDVSWEVIRKDVYEAMALFYEKMNKSCHNLLHSLGLGCEH